jgi:hypothetical protein
MWWTVDSLALPQDVFGLAKEMHEQMSLLNAEWNTLDTFFFHPLIWNDTWWYSDIWNALFESPTIISIRNLCSENLNWPVFLVHSDALFKAYAPRQVCTLMAGEIGPAETAAFNLVSWWQFIWLRCLRSKSWEQSWSHITKNTWDESILDTMFSAEKVSQHASDFCCIELLSPEFCFYEWFQNLTKFRDIKPPYLLDELFFLISQNFGIIHFWYIFVRVSNLTCFSQVVFFKPQVGNMWWRTLGL